MTRRFSKVSAGVWRSKRFAGLSGNDAKLLYFYFVSSEHQNSIGAYVIPDGYATADLGWTLADYQQARRELVGADLIAFDEETLTVYVLRWFRHCPPMNNSHAQSCLRLIGELECETIADMVQADFDKAEQKRGAAGPKPSALRDSRSADHPWPVRIGSGR